MHLMVQPRGPLIEVTAKEGGLVDINVYNQQPELIAQATDVGAGTRHPIRPTGVT